MGGGGRGARRWPGVSRCLLPGPAPAGAVACGPGQARAAQYRSKCNAPSRSARAPPPPPPSVCTPLWAARSRQPGDPGVVGLVSFLGMECPCDRGHEHDGDSGRRVSREPALVSFASDAAPHPHRPHPLHSSRPLPESQNWPVPWRLRSEALGPGNAVLSRMEIQTPGHVVVRDEDLAAEREEVRGRVSVQGGRPVRILTPNRVRILLGA